MPSPENIRPCRWHVREYGFMAANPLATKAFKAPSATKTTVNAGEEFTLAFGVLLHSTEHQEALDLQAVYEEYLRRRKAE